MQHCYTIKNMNCGKIPVVVKKYEVLLAISLTGADKLDRGYLPPPGAHSAGGVFYDDKLELPKETFQYTNANYGLENMANTTPDVQTVDDDGNSGITESVLPVSFFDKHIFTLKSSQILTQTTKILPKSEDLSINSKSEFHELPNRNVMIQFQNEFVDTISDIPDLSKVTTEKYLKANRSLVDNTRPSLLIEKINVYSSKEIPNKGSAFTTSFNKTDSTTSLNDNFSNEVNLHLNKDTSKPNIPITSIPTPKIFMKYPERSHAANDRNAITINYENKYIPGGFSYTFDTSNNIHVDERGTADRGVKAKGSYSYVGDDGKLYSIEYTADENGFQPRGSHLPTPPPIPKEIQKVIEQAYKNKKAGIFDDGSYDEKKYGYKKYMPLTDKVYGSYLRTNVHENTRRGMDEKIVLKRPGLDTLKTDRSLPDNRNTVWSTYDTNNYESTTPALKYNTVSNADEYYSTVNAPTTNSYTSTSDELDDKIRYHIHHDQVLTPQDSSTMPATPSDFTSSEYFETVTPYINNHQKTTGQVLKEDFSGPKQYQRYDPNTGYHY